MLFSVHGSRMRRTPERRKNKPRVIHIATSILLSTSCGTSASYLLNLLPMLVESSPNVGEKIIGP